MIQTYPNQETHLAGAQLHNMQILSDSSNLCCDVTMNRYSNLQTKGFHNMLVTKQVV